MFYCNRCAHQNDWPLTGFKSEGKCELCEKIAVCNDMPSHMLPLKPAPTNAAPAE